MFVAVMTAYAWDRSSYVLDTSSLDLHVILTGLALFALSLAWLFGDRRWSTDSPVHVWIPVAVTALALMVGNYRSMHSVPVWKLSDGIREPGPFETARTYLALLTFQDVFERKPLGGQIMDAKDLDGEIGRCGNAAMYSGVSFVNGYSPMGMVPYAKLLGMQWCGFTTLPQGELLLKNHAAAGRLFKPTGRRWAGSRTWFCKVRQTGGTIGLESRETTFPGNRFSPSGTADAPRSLAKGRGAGQLR